MPGVISGGGQWAYVAAAYALTAFLTGAVLLHSWQAMRKAEKRSDVLRADRRSGGALPGNHE